jgi:hypothetical protein
MQVLDLEWPEVQAAVLPVGVEAINLRLSAASQKQLLVDPNSSSAVGNTLCRQFVTYALRHH